MNTTSSLPGFTAEASLYSSGTHYASAAMDVSSVDRVLPQIPIGLCTKAAYYCIRGYEKWCLIFDRNCETDV